jgi:sialidase-1
MLSTPMTKKLLWMPLLIPALALAADAFITHTDVFRAGEDGYHTYRIPAIVTAQDGSLVAFAEARKENQNDPGGGDIDLVAKRSTDNGATWSRMQIVDNPGEKWGASNPTPVLDRSNGRLWIAFNRWEPGKGTENSRAGTTDNQAWLRYSDDNGQTWSAPRDITRESRDFDNWRAMFLGPGGAIQTRTGRLILPAAACPDTCAVYAASGTFRGQMHNMRSYVLYSDDHGATWKRGPQVRAITDENELVELADGTILMDARQGGGDARWVMFSRDGGETWSTPRNGEIVTPVATGIERFTSAKAGADRDRILWTGPQGNARRRLVVRVSYDEGQTFVNEHLIYGGLSAYSDISILKDGTVGVLWERGVSGQCQFITFTHFNREFLEPPGTVIPVLH